MSFLLGWLERLWPLLVWSRAALHSCTAGGQQPKGRGVSTLGDLTWWEHCPPTLQPHRGGPPSVAVGEGSKPAGDPGSRQRHPGVGPPDESHPILAWGAGEHRVLLSQGSASPISNERDSLCTGVQPLGGLLFQSSTATTRPTSPWNWWCQLPAHSSCRRAGSRVFQKFCPRSGSGILFHVLTWTRGSLKAGVQPWVHWWMARLVRWEEPSVGILRCLQRGAQGR